MRYEEAFGIIRQGPVHLFRAGASSAATRDWGSVRPRASTTGLRSNPYPSCSTPIACACPGACGPGCRFGVSCPWPGKVWRRMVQRPKGKETHD